jgi:predicted hydrocarbon binding protein
MTKIKTTGIANAGFRQLLIAAERVLTKEELITILNQSDLERFVNKLPEDNLSLEVSLDEYSRFNQAIEAKYERGGKAVLKRIGEEIFRKALEEQRALLGAAGLALKLMPESHRIRFVLKSVASVVQSTNPSADILIDESDGTFNYTDHNCAICHGQESEHPSCYLKVGELEAAVRWAVGTRYRVRETQCAAMKGENACRFEIIAKT